MMWMAVCIHAVGLWTRWTVALGLAVCVAIWLLVTKHDAGVSWLLAGQVGLLLLLPTVPWHARVRGQRWDRVSQAHVTTTRAAVSSIEAEVAALTTQRDQLHEANSQLVELYQVTKETAGEVHADSLFRALTKVLSTVLPFRTGWLLLTTPEGESVACVDGWVSRVDAGEVRTEPAAATLPPWHGPLLQWVAHHATAQHITAGHAVPWALSPTTELVTEDVAWMPLVIQERVRGLLVFEGLPDTKFHSAQVIAQQVSLQLQRIQLYEQLEQLAVSDGLTGIPVRRYFEERVNDELARAARRHVPMAMLLGDIDHFKQLNDTYGHLVGDEVLKRVAQVLQSNVREIDVLGRYGGEEFVLALVDTGPEEALHVAERIREAIAQERIHAYDETVQVTISFGIAQFPHDGTTAHDVFECADRALYQAKAAGRNHVVVFTETSRGAT